MGSGALKNWSPVRISAKTKEWLEPSLHDILRVVGVRGARITPVPAYRNKPSFGDLDFLVEGTWFGGQEPPAEVFARTVGPGYPVLVRNGGVNSVGVLVSDEEVSGIFQVDLISAPTDRYDWTLSYLSWNDVGNLIGRVGRTADLKFGHDGLYYTVRTGDGSDVSRFFEDVLISKDWSVAVEFLGFDSKRWAEGFDTIEDIHQFIRAGKYVSAEAFFARNQRDRYRDEKRPVYGGFVQGLEDNPLPDYRCVPASKGQARYDWVTSAFPDAKEKIDASVERARLREVTKDRFNSYLVMKLTGREGPDLGKMMVHLRRKMTGMDTDPPHALLTETINSMTDEEIEKIILTAAKELE